MIKKYQNPAGGITGSSRLGNESMSLYIMLNSPMNFNFGPTMPSLNNDLTTSVQGSILKDMLGLINWNRFNNFFNNYGSGIGTAASAAFSLMGTNDKVINSNDELSLNIRTNVNNYMMQTGNPWLMAAGATNTIIDKTGGFTDASQGLGGTNDTANFIASLALPGFGWFTSRLPKYTKSLELANSTGYTGTSALGDKVAKISGGKYLFGRGRAKDMINDQIKADHLVADNVREGQDALLLGSNLASQNNEAYNLALHGGYDLKTQIGKEGMKILKDAVISHRSGGTFNIIPTGALHARLHHMEDAEGLTKKGIPVVDNEGHLLAEIELNEIIFRKEVTDQIESLREEGTDEAAIQAGKLLVEEIFNNTKDYTGLLDKLAKGGTIKGQNGLDVGMIMDIFGKGNSGGGSGLGTAIGIASTALNSAIESKRKIKEKEELLDMQKAWSDYLKQMLDALKQLNQALQLNQIQTTLAIPTALNGDKLPYVEWVKDVNKDYLSENYDLETAYKYFPLKQMNKWKFAVNSKNPKFYMDYLEPEFDKNGILTGNMTYPYHLDSVVPLNNGDFMFLKLGTEETNPELHWETDKYYSGENKLKDTHDLKFEEKENRYYYRKKNPSKKENGGIIEQLSNLSPEKLKELENILKYLHD